MVRQIQEIPLSNVDLEDHPFTVASTAEIEPLLTSIKAVGLLNLPWLRQKDTARWQVVAGLKRLMALTRLGWEFLPAQTLASETLDSRCLLISLYDNAFCRSFNSWEQASFARKLLDHFDRPAITQQFLPLLGLPTSTKILDRLLAVASLEEAWQPLLEKGRLALTAAARLAAWPPEDRRAALPFLQTLPFSQSKQEEFLEWLELLARREGIAQEEILSRPELEDSLNDPSLTPQQKAEAVRHTMKNWVFPRSAAAQEAFQSDLARLGLAQHPRLRLTPPPSFEGPDFHLEIKFRDAAELKDLLLELTHKDFSNLMSI